MTVKEELQAARALIENGWQQGWYWNMTKDAYCVSGAIFQATGTMDSLHGPTYRALQEAVFPFPIEIKGSLSVWNDAPERTKEQVLAAFDVAIASQP